MDTIQKNIKDFEFYYLVELTRQKIKPLSRWEKPLPERTHRWLRRHGLYVEQIPRKTQSGNSLTETIFSTSENYTNLYQKNFSETLINNNSKSQELEGFLFGYPSCCIKQFIRHPHLRLPAMLFIFSRKVASHVRARKTVELIRLYYLHFWTIQPEIM